MEKFLVLLMLLMPFGNYGLSEEIKDTAKAAEKKEEVVQEVKDLAPAAVNVTLKESNTLRFYGPVTADSVARLAQKAVEMDQKLAPGEPIYLVIDSGGGSISAGLELVTVLRSLSREVHTISLFSASMAFHLVQNLDKRYITPDGTLMSHKPRGGFQGEFPGQLTNRYARFLKKIDNLDERVIARTDGRYSLFLYRDLIENEYWCDGIFCLNDKFVDAIVHARCDKSLSGTRDLVSQRIVNQKRKKGKKESDDIKDKFEIIEAVEVYSKCPLITYPIGWTIKIDGVPIFTHERAGATFLGNRRVNEMIENLEKKMKARKKTSIGFTQ